MKKRKKAKKKVDPFVSLIKAAYGHEPKSSFRGLSPEFPDKNMLRLFIEGGDMVVFLKDDKIAKVARAINERMYADLKKRFVII